MAVKFVPKDFEKVKEVEFKSDDTQPPFKQRVRMEKCRLRKIFVKYLEADVKELNLVFFQDNV